ncbi:MAG: segregation/condensation protein A [Alphaproteobacteria bacterium]|nr:segregation/condensation protein A [Alphaproteobacteria bacterium]MBU0797112.1 segregation/condensation protein A [Alphaproteobacteria bacterium]MBU0887919.1 segregation/condensation protein A [Alphaproteobacteria bacterium]MBU1814858.1 segregation/condensation protein A [Alphaproteobacteria bacterium]
MAGTPFEEDAAPAAIGPQLILDLEGFEGPIDLLLTLARDQKVDLAKISILKLADQYLAFINQARRLHLEIAADYLVMAAWLAFLKSRLLLPPPPGEAEPSGEEMAEALAFQLQRLGAMQEAGVRLMAQPRLGQDVFARGAPEMFPAVIRSTLDVSLYDILKAYADFRRKSEHQSLRIAPTKLYSIEDALERLRHLVGRIPDWTVLQSFLPEGLVDPIVIRSALAANFGASLELAKQGAIELRQGETFGPIYLRTRSRDDS